MKKIIALTIVAMFLIGLVPFTFAEEVITVETETETEDDSSGTNMDSGTRVVTKTGILRDRLEDVRDVKENIRDKKEDVRDLKEDMRDRKENRRDRLEDLKSKHPNLNANEMAKLNALGRANLGAWSNADSARLKAHLKNVTVRKVKTAEDLLDRKLSDQEHEKLKERFESAKEKFKVAKDELKDIRVELREAKQNKDENATINHSKKYLLRTADALISHLEKLKTRVQENENIPDDRAANIVAEIDADIAAVVQIKVEIEAATTKEQIKELAKKLRKLWNNLKHNMNFYAHRVVSARVEGIINHGVILEKRLDKILDRLNSSGVNVSVETEVNEFSAKIALSKEKYTAAQAKLQEAFELKVRGNNTNSTNTRNEEFKKLLDEAKGLLDEARAALKEAHEVLRDIVKKIKEAKPDADLSADVEVEVAQEASLDSNIVETNITTETTGDAEAST